MKYLLLIFMLYTAIDIQAQMLRFSKNKIIFAYSPLSYELADTVTIFNDDSMKLEIDSIYSANYYGYRLIIFLQDTSVFYYVFGGQDLAAITINPNDSALFVFSEPSLCPICKSLQKVKAFSDTIIFYSNSKDSNYSYLEVEGLGNVDVEKKKQGIKEIILFQNHPNPFNPATTIVYELPEYSYTTLRVYDLLGREVKTLVDKEQTAGHYEFNFNGSDLNSGVYFYQLKTGSGFIVKKMLLTK